MISSRHVVWIVALSTMTCVGSSPRRACGDAGEVGARDWRAEGSAGQPARPWPVDIPIHLSSSFGEFRGGHLHAGVDIRSFGREGIPCLAVGRGHVSRLRASPFGYGLAVYLKLDTGETVVYAHLSEFASSIDSVVYAAQVRNQKYQVDIYPAPGDLPVEEGQVVGYTGRTGASAPHLHFEVRDASECPVNPLEKGWALRDGDAPVVRRLECLPLASFSRVNGCFAPAVVEMRAVAPHTFAAAETLRVSGEVGFAVEVVDRAGGDSGNLAPYRLELELDGRRVASVEMRRFSYEQASEVELVYDMAEARTHGRHYVILFRRGGETLAGREFVEDGIVRIDSPPAGAVNRSAAQSLVERAVDFSGNTSTASCVLTGADPSSGPAGGAGDGIVSANGELPGLYFFEGLMSGRGLEVGEDAPLTPGALERRTAAGTGRAGPREVVLSFDEVRDRGPVIPVRTGGSPGEVYVVAARRDDALAEEVAELGVGLSVGAGSLYSDALLYLAAWDDEAGGRAAESAGMRLLTRGVRFGPVSAVFKAPVEIRFVAGHGASSGAGVFGFDERKQSWSFKASSMRGDTVTARVRDPGVYAVLEDVLAPSVGTPTLSTRKSFATGQTVREVVIPVIDGGCGVDAEDTEVYIDGRKQIARWDGFSEKIVVILRGENIIGVHDLSVVAVDRLGNSTRLNTQLRVSPTATEDSTGGPR